MTRRTHLVGAIFIGLLLERITALFDWPILPMGLTFQLGQITMPAYILAITALTLGALYPCLDEVGSRDRPTMFHWLVTSLGTAIVFSLAGLFFRFPDFGFWFFLGALSHLGLDLLTESGLAVLGPFTNHRFHLLPRGYRLVRGSLAEDVLSLVLSVIAAGLLFWSISALPDFIIIRPNFRSPF